MRNIFKKGAKVIGCGIVIIGINISIIKLTSFQLQRDRILTPRDSLSISHWVKTGKCLMDSDRFFDGYAEIKQPFEVYLGERRE